MSSSRPTRRADGAQAATLESFEIDGRSVEYRVVHSKAARKLRVRVGPAGVELVRPPERADVEVEAFVRANGAWIVGQQERAERLRRVRRSERSYAGEILLRGRSTIVRLEHHPYRRGPNRVVHEESELIIIRGTSPTPPHRSLEYWLRRQARADLEQQIAVITPRLRCDPGRVFVMNQRTKWGNCSPTGNLSFNWRLVMAPPIVLRYLVTHEATHLVVPDHSARFWLTVQSLCPEAERARQWLAAHGYRLQVELAEVCRPR